MLFTPKPWKEPSSWPLYVLYRCPSAVYMYTLYPMLGVSHTAIHLPSGLHFNPCASVVGSVVVLINLYVEGSCNVKTSCAAGLDNSANTPLRGLKANPLFANLGSRISTVLLVCSDQTVTLDPKSENTKTSSCVRPKSALTTLPIPPLPFLMVAVHRSSSKSHARACS